MAFIPISKYPLGFAQVFLYFLVCIFGFFVCLPMGFTLRNFHGSCILFSQIVWDNTVLWPWADSTCEFVLYSNLAVNIIYGAMMGLTMLVLYWPRTPSKHYESLKSLENYSARYLAQGLNPVFCAINLIVCLLMICSASVLSAGFARFCLWMEEDMPDVMQGSCINMMYVDWAHIRIRGGTSMGINGYNTHIAIIFAMLFSWLSVIAWIMQLIINFSQSCRRCSCEIAEEKRKPDRSAIIAARRSRLATPIGTPGGHTPGGHTPVPMGAPMPALHQMGAPMPQPYHPQPYIQQGPPSHHGGPPLNPQVLMAPPPPKGQYR